MSRFGTTGGRGGSVRLTMVVAVMASAGALGGCGSSTSPSVSEPASAPATSGSVAAGTTSGAAPGGSATTFPVPAVVKTFAKGLPTGAPADVRTSYVTWGGAGELLVVTFGSGTCPRLPEAVTRTGDNAITVTIADTSNVKVPCTMDFGPTTATVAVPAGIDDSKDVQVAIDDQESTLVPRKG